MTARGTLLALLAFLAVLAPACGTSNSAEPASTSSTAAPTTTDGNTTTTELPATTAAPTTTEQSTTTVAAQCPGDGALPEGVEPSTLASADVDGDGDIDEIRTYQSSGEWKLQVSFAGGGGTTVTVTTPNVDLTGALAFDGIDINGSGKEEFFAKIGGGASAEAFGLYEVADCQLQAIQSEGEQAVFYRGGGVNIFSHFACHDLDGNGANDFIVTFEGNRLGETSEFEVTATEYAVLDGQLQLIESKVTVRDENDLSFPGYFGTPSCGVGL